MVVGRQHADQEGGDAHDHQGHHQHALAADLVAEVAEDHAADGARQEAHGEGAVGQHGRDERIAAREIQLAEHDAGDDAV